MSCQVKLFEINQVLSKQNKIQSISQGESQLFIGYQNSTIDSYNILQQQNYQLKLQKQFPQQKQGGLFTKSYLEQIKEFNGNVIAIIDGALLYYNGQTLEKIDTLIEKQCVNFTINEFIPHKVLAITKKKEALVLDFDQKTFSFKGIKERINLTEIPLIFGFVSDYIIMVNSKKEYMYSSLSKNQEFKTYNIPKNEIQPFFKIISENEIFLLISNNTGIFVTLQGELIPKSTIQLNNKPIFQINIIENYLLAFYEQNLIQIFNYCEPALIQEIQFDLEGTIKSISQSNSKISNQVIYIASLSEIKCIYTLAFDDQIQKLLLECKIEDALCLFEQHYYKITPEKQRKQNELYINASWFCIYYGKFQEAQKYLENVQKNILFDVRQYIEILNTEQDMQILIDKINENKKKSKENTLQNNQAKNQILQFLIFICKSERDYYLKYLHEQNKTFEFFISPHTFKNYIPNMSQNNSKQILQVIDFNLLKYIFMSENIRYELEYLLSQNNLQISPEQQQKQFIELIQLAQDKLQQSLPLLSKFYEYFSKYIDALNMWKEKAEKNEKNQNLIKQAIENTIRILKETKKEAFIIQYLPWVLQQDLKKAYQVFTIMDPEQFYPSLILRFLDEVPNIDQEEVKCEYLQTILMNFKYNDQSLHNKLCEYFINQLFQQFDKTYCFQDVRDSVRSLQQIDKYYELLSFLQNSNSQYDAEQILSLIKDSWLHQHQIYILSKLEKHEIALQKLILLENFEEARSYCLNDSKKLIPILFKTYLKIQQEEKASSEKRNLYSQKALEVLQQFSEFEEVNPVDIVDLIPNDWNFSDSQNNILAIFLQQALSETLHKKRQVKCTKNASEVSLLDNTLKVVHAKKAYITFYNDRKCAVCNKGILNTIFGLFPNGVVAHQSCISKNINICPQTQQDFKKTFKYV
ncbi:transforming growth beta receptor associated protein 1, putative [Ichthyophthirius multifiliis]|uniref:Transforming growth beta receptor associated protein 1, putative n=1 Tax=Ichthyophthirius multifiliis TaxID=5932 RepID=G0QPM6_ICHMU|nr:transforming growth beta receptor associated protein 1, putative [Ichthyophthirius multifiliis]EGR32826.1 transforming growth beta receptor associated protein 1, putative [Ichthyophthirius multifiliis]|eukprot:XP_004036812.1 transforming growth beta receptor associated protein 1, putative [Ichthyophthirius multifiliis]